MATGKPIELDLGGKSYKFNGYASNVSYERDTVDVTMVGDPSRHIMPLGGRVHVTYELGGPIEEAAPTPPLNESLTQGSLPALSESHEAYCVDFNHVMNNFLKLLGFVMWAVGWFLYAKVI